jgi:hypothetical protein
MSFDVLTPDGNDAIRWLAAIDRLPVGLRDVHLTLEYAAAQTFLGVEPRLAVYEHEGYVVVQPFALRKVSVGGIEAFDIANLYGYGGPISNHGEQLYEWFDRSFTGWCRDMGVVSEFCALNPMSGSHQDSLLRRTVQTVERKPVVVVDLSRPIGSTYRDRRAAGVKAATKHGVNVTSNTTDFEDREFVRLYNVTMRRRRAARRWDFPDAYLMALCNLGTVFCAVMPDGDVESAGLMLDGQNGVAYYHLAGNMMNARKAGANDLLIHEMALCAQRMGCKMLHLGGGATSKLDDPVLAYKAGFSDARLMAKTYFRVLDEARYHELCMAKAAQEIADTGAPFTTSFQPMYRREGS